MTKDDIQRITLLLNGELLSDDEAPAIEEAVNRYDGIEIIDGGPQYDCAIPSGYEEVAPQIADAAPLQGER